MALVQIPHRLQQSKRPSGVYVGCVQRLVEGDAYVGLSGQMVNLVRLHELNDPTKARMVSR